MSKGGGTTKQVSEPWKQAQPYVLEGMDMARGVVNNPAKFYPGQTFLVPSDAQMGAWDTRLGYSDSVFGGAQAPKFGEATGALSGLLEGGGLGQLSGGVTPQALNTLGDWNQFGQAGGLDATGAINRMLSGTPDYAGAQGAIDAANAPILRQFEQDILPSLNSRATFLNNETGGVKALNRVLPDIAERMSTNAGTILNNERLRALGSQEGAAGLVSQGGQQANQGALGLGQLAGSLAGGASGDQARALGLFPTIAGFGEGQGVLAGQFADWAQQYPQQALNEDMARWDYSQNQPQDLATWYSSLVNGTAGLGGTSSGKTPTNTGLNALGGAATGAALGSAIPALGAGWGAGLGALAAFL